MKTPIGKIGRMLALAAAFVGMTAWGAPVAKIGETPYESLKAAIGAAQDGQTIVVTADHTVPYANIENNAVINKSITIDFNGCKVVAEKGNDLYQKGVFTINGEGITVTFKNSAQTEGGLSTEFVRAVEVLKGTMILESGYFGATGGGAAGVISVRNGSLCKLNGGKVYVTAAASSSSPAIVYVDGASIELNGTEIVSDLTSKRYNGICCDNTGNDIKITGGSISLKGNQSVAVSAPYSGDAAAVTITGGDLRVDGENSKIVNLSDAKSTLDVAGGTFTLETTGTQIKHSVIGVAPGVKVNITGMTVKAANKERARLFNDTNMSSEDVKVTGGSYEAEIPEAYVAGVLLQDATTGAWGIRGVNVLTIHANGTTADFVSLPDAFAAAQDGDVIKMGVDCNYVISKEDATAKSAVIRTPALAGKAVTLDLNGKKIGTTPDACAIILNEGANLTIVDSSSSQKGCITRSTGAGAPWCACDGAIVCVKGKNVTVNVQGGAIEFGNGDSDMEAAIGFSHDEWGTTYDDKNLAVSISGGKLIGHNAANSVVDAMANNNVAVTVTGGTFDGVTTAKGFFKVTGQQNCSVKIAGGSFKSEAPIVPAGTPAKVEVSGGSFKTEIAPEYCAVGKRCKKSGNSFVMETFDVEITVADAAPATIAAKVQSAEGGEALSAEVAAQVAQKVSAAAQNRAVLNATGTGIQQAVKKDGKIDAEVIKSLKASAQKTATKDAINENLSVEGTVIQSNWTPTATTLGEVTKIECDITPAARVFVPATGETVITEVPPESFESITFRLGLPNDYAGWASIKHRNDDFLAKVEGTAGEKYVTLTFTQFSKVWLAVTTETPVATIGDVGFASLEKAFEAADSGETIVLQENATVTETIPVKGSVALDLNGMTVTGPTAAELFDLGNSALLKVMGGTITGKTLAKGVSGSTLQLKSGTFTVDAIAADETPMTVAVSGGTFKEAIPQKFVAVNYELTGDGKSVQSTVFEEINDGVEFTDAVDLDTRDEPRMIAKDASDTFDYSALNWNENFVAEAQAAVACYRDNDLTQATQVEVTGENPTSFAYTFEYNGVYYFTHSYGTADENKTVEDALFYATDLITQLGDRGFVTAVTEDGTNVAKVVVDVRADLDETLVIQEPVPVEVLMNGYTIRGRNGQQGDIDGKPAVMIGGHQEVVFLGGGELQGGDSYEASSASKGGIAVVDMDGKAFVGTGLVLNQTITKNGLAGANYEIVSVKQRYPWNGKVDIVYNLTRTLKGADGSASDYKVEFTVYKQGEEPYVAQTFLNTAEFTEGEHHLIWDARADYKNLVLKGYKCKLVIKRRQ